MYWKLSPKPKSLQHWSNVSRKYRAQERNGKSAIIDMVSKIKIHVIKKRQRPIATREEWKTKREKHTGGGSCEEQERVQMRESDGTEQTDNTTQTHNDNHTESRKEKTPMKKLQIKQVL